MGRSPTGVITEYLPPISSGTTNVLYFFKSDMLFKAPLNWSVTTNIRLFDSAPYFSSIKFLKILNDSAVSIVVPDFEITIIHTFFSFTSWISFFKYEPLKF